MNSSKERNIKNKKNNQENQISIINLILWLLIDPKRSLTHNANMSCLLKLKKRTSRDSQYLTKIQLRSFIYKIYQILKNPITNKRNLDHSVIPKLNLCSKIKYKYLSPQRIC